MKQKNYPVLCHGYILCGYCEIYDAKYDINSRKWLEVICLNPDCPYCRNRPKKHPKNCTCNKINE